MIVKIFESTTKYKLVKLRDLGQIKTGKKKYDKRYCNKNLGEYPVYSANTKTGGVIGKIGSYDFDCECVRITTGGKYAGTSEYISKQKFSITSAAVIFCLHERYKETVDYKYLERYINYLVLSKSFGYSKRPKLLDIENFEIKIPIDISGEFSLSKQKNICSRCDNIVEIIKKLENYLDKFRSINFEIIFTQ